MQLADALAQGRPLLADGGVATTLFDMGLAVGVPPELWNDLHPDRVQALHRRFVDAGADIILTNSFGGNTRRLMLHDLQGRCRAINHTAARLARAVADRAGRPVVVGGSVGPAGRLTETEAVEAFTAQIEGLAEGGVDVAWIETMGSSDEMRAASTAAARVGLPFTVTASFHNAGRTATGLRPADFAGFATRLSPTPLAIGANCGVGPSDLLASILDMVAEHPAVRLIAKANAGLPQRQSGGLRYACTPSLMADYARLAIDLGVIIVGGCCGTSPRHVAAMRRTIDTAIKRDAPTLETITRRLGPLVAVRRYSDRR